MNRIRQLRNETGIKQTELCKILGVSQAALSGYETGNYEPDHAILIKIADYFGVTTDYILGVSDKKTPTPKEADANPDMIELERVMETLSPELRKMVLTHAQDLAKIAHMTKPDV